MSGLPARLASTKIYQIQKKKASYTHTHTSDNQTCTKEMSNTLTHNCPLQTLHTHTHTSKSSRADYRHDQGRNFTCGHNSHALLKSYAHRPLWPRCPALCLFCFFLSLPCLTALVGQVFPGNVMLVHVLDWLTVMGSTRVTNKNTRIKRALVLKFLTELGKVAVLSLPNTYILSNRYCA